MSVIIPDIDLLGLTAFHLELIFTSQDISQVTSGACGQRNSAAGFVTSEWSRQEVETVGGERAHQIESS